MSEPLSATEIGKEISAHARHAGLDDHTRRHQVILIVEAVLLSIVTLTAAWSGYSAAKWEGASEIHLSDAASIESRANRGFQNAATIRAQDSVNFSVSFNAYLGGNVVGQPSPEVVPGRLEPAFRAWLTTDPFSNPNAPKSPQYMPQYQEAGLTAARHLDAEARALAEGHRAAKTGHDYIRVTVILASVLFIVGISSHFPASGIRIGLAAVGGVLLIVGAIAILQLPGPPS